MKTRDVSGTISKKLTVSELQVDKVYLGSHSKHLYIVLKNSTGQVVNLTANSVYSRYDLSGEFTEVEAEVLYNEVIGAA